MSRSRAPRKPPPLQVKGSLWVDVDGQALGGHGRMALLRAVAEQGSITQAARALGISYKAAWDAIDAMNRLAARPLVERAAGGRGGGSTRLTAHGLRLVQRYEQVEAVHQRFVRLLADQGMDLEREFSLLQVLNVKTSARNQWVGTVGAIRAGAVNDEVEVLLADGPHAPDGRHAPGSTPLTAVITRESTQALGLQPGQPVIAFVKASAVLLATGLGPVRVSARNRLEGTVSQVRPGAVNAEVTVQAANGLPVVAVVTQAAVDSLGLRPGIPVTVLVQASDVLLASVS
jgi:molybdate transport system regulatory protein